MEEAVSCLYVVLGLATIEITSNERIHYYVIPTYRVHNICTRALDSRLQYIHTYARP